MKLALLILAWPASSILFVGALVLCRSLSSGKPRRRSWQAPWHKAMLPR